MYKIKTESNSRLYGLKNIKVFPHVKDGVNFLNLSGDCDMGEDIFTVNFPLISLEEINLSVDEFRNCFLIFRLLARKDDASLYTIIKKESPAKEMTVAEIESKLGYKIKVVG